MFPFSLYYLFAVWDFHLNFRTAPQVCCFTVLYAFHVTPAILDYLPPIRFPSPTVGKLFLYQYVKDQFVLSEAVRSKTATVILNDTSEYLCKQESSYCYEYRIAQSLVPVFAKQDIREKPYRKFFKFFHGCICV